MKKTTTPNIIIATVFSNLLNKHFAVNNADEALVVEAIKRSNTSLHDASLTELGDYLSRMNASQLKGLANNVKGIYHELKYVDSVNHFDSTTHAQVYESTNHAGADIVFRDINNGEIVKEVQLKATDSTSYVSQHISRYPDIDVMATSEVAEKMSGVESTGFSNAELTDAVNRQFDQVSDLSTQAQIGDAAAVSGLLSAALRASEVISGKKKLGKAGKDALLDIGISTSTTALVAFLFG